MKYLFIVVSFLHMFCETYAIWCYQCTAATPGCSTPFNWRGVGYLGSPCPESEDVCVKLIERKGETIERYQLSVACNYATYTPFFLSKIHVRNLPICECGFDKGFPNEIITRDCLSNFKAFRTDIPADTYEGCRPAAKDVNLAHYVQNNSIKEFDVKRDWYDNTMWCFCFLDHRCNNASSMSKSIVLLCALNLMILIKKTYF